MESHKPDEPIIAELKRLQANTSGRRFWSWMFFFGDYGSVFNSSFSG
jgi:hypothetical protein